MNQRDSFFDNLKFFLIFLVILGHFIEPLSGGQTFKPLYLWIISFHMPLFALVSGYLSKNINDDRYARKIFVNLVAPYFVFETIYTLFDYWLMDRNTLIFSYFTPYWIMWYLFSMIIWKIMLPYVVKFKYALPVSFLLAIMCGYASDVGYYASMSRTIVFFPFFLTGYYLKKEFIIKVQSWLFRVCAVIIASSTFLLIYKYGRNIKMHWFHGSYSYAQAGATEWYAGIYRLEVFCLTSLLILSVISLTPNFRIPFITVLGKNTLPAYLLHGFIILFISKKTMFFTHFTNSLSKLALVMLIFFLAMLLSSEPVNKVFRQVFDPVLNMRLKKKNVTQ